MASEKQREVLLAEIDSVLRNNVRYGGMVAAIAAGSGTPYPFKTDLPGGMSDTTLFGIGSITKIFVAVVVLQLVEEAKLRLTDSVQQHLPIDIYCDIENASTATIQQLLSHTAGVDSWEDDPVWLIDGRGANADVSRTWTKTKTLDYIRRPRQTAPDPGSWYYSNTNYTLLGLIIESATGSTAEGEIRRRILEPLQMSHTFVEGFEDGPHDGASRRYHYTSKQFRETAGISTDFSPVSDDFMDVTGSNLSVSWMAGGMISHPLDLVKFAVALRDGALLSPSSTACMQNWRETTIPKHQMGLGLFRQSSSAGTWLGHSGGVLGFSAQLWWREGHDCVLVVLANVGTVNAGSVSFGTGAVIQKSNLLELAAHLVECNH